MSKLTLARQFRCFGPFHRQPIFVVPPPTDSTNTSMAARASSAWMRLGPPPFRVTVTEDPVHPSACPAKVTAPLCVRTTSDSIPVESIGRVSVESTQTVGPPQPPPIIRQPEVARDTIAVTV